MATDALRKFAEELKFIRESKEVSLQQIAGKTKIDIKFLNAIENANFDILPELYVKAFIKEYAQQIDLNPNETIRKFESARTGRSEQPEQVKAVQTPPAQTQPDKEAPTKKITEEINHVEQIAPSIQTNEKDANGSKVNLNFVYGGIIVVLALALVYVIFIRESSHDVVQETQIEKPVNQSNSRFEMQNHDTAQTKAPEEPQTVPGKPDSLRIRLQTSAKVWVKINADGKILHQQTVLPETNLNYTASKYFSVSVGNAGVVKLFFNSKPVPNIGNVGQIRNIYLSADTIRYLTIAPQPKNEKQPPTAN